MRTGAHRSWGWLAFFLVGCSVVNDPVQHQPYPVEAAEYCVELGRIFCEGRRDCCEMPELPVDACITNFATNMIACRIFGLIVVDPRTGYDAELAGEILADGRRLGRACSTDLAQWATDAISLVLTGTIAPGEPCSESDTDISSMFVCAGDSACVKQDPLMMRYSCLTRLPESGGPCRSPRDCELGLYCAPADITLTRRCQPRLANGAVCADHPDCASSLCRDGLCVEASVDNIYCRD